MILDTSFLLDLKDTREPAFEKAMEIYEADVVQRVAMPSVMELHYGAAYTDSAEELRRVRNLLLMYPIVSLDETMARRAAELLAAADRQADGDSGVDNEDARIGAVADHYDWMREASTLDGEWSDPDRWRDWFDEQLPDDHDLDEDRRVELRERDVDRSFETYLSDDEIEQRGVRGQKRLLDHVDDDLILDAAREIEAERRPNEVSD